MLERLSDHLARMDTRSLLKHNILLFVLLLVSVELKYAYGHSYDRFQLAMLALHGILIVVGCLTVWIGATLVSKKGPRMLLHNAKVSSRR